MTAVIVTCGDLSARRPGRATRKQPLPAERQRLGAMSIFKHAGRRLVRRDLGADAFARVKGAGGRQATTGHRSPINSLGLGRAFQPRKQSRSGLTNRFQVNHSLRDAPACHEQSDRSDVECPTKALKRLTR